MKPGSWCCRSARSRCGRWRQGSCVACGTRVARCSGVSGSSCRCRTWWRIGPVWRFSATSTSPCMRAMVGVTPILRSSCGPSRTARRHRRWWLCLYRWMVLPRGLPRRRGRECGGLWGCCRRGWRSLRWRRRGWCSSPGARWLWGRVRSLIWLGRRCGGCCVALSRRIQAVSWSSISSRWAPGPVTLGGPIVGMVGRSLIGLGCWRLASRRWLSGMSVCSCRGSSRSRACRRRRLRLTRRALC